MTDNIKVRCKFADTAFNYDGPAGLMKDAIDEVQRLQESAHSILSDRKDPTTKANKAVGKKTSAAKPAGKGNKRGQKPKFNSNLNLVGLNPFYKSLTLKSVPEHVVAFMIFLSSELEMEKVTSDDIYSCFFHLRAENKVPAFPKALENTKSKTGMIDYDRGFTDPRLTVAGENHFHHEISKREA